MRKWHRWISVLFGIFILFIATTGLLSQIGTLVNNGGFEKEEPAAAKPAAAASGNALIPSAQAHETEAAAPVPAAFTCPETMTCRPKRVPKPGEWNVGFLHHIHSGEEFGPIGVIISMMSGVALIFFAISGLWMYVELYRGRMTRVRSGKPVQGGRFFWK